MFAKRGRIVLSQTIEDRVDLCFQAAIPAETNRHGSYNAELMGALHRCELLEHLLVVVLNSILTIT